jgi:hypothetical protein
MNFGLCGKADKRKRLKIAKGKQPVCPECAQPLDTREPSARFPWRLVASMMAIFLMAVAVEVHQWEPNRDAHGRGSPTTEAGIRILHRLRDTSRAGSAVASSLAETVLQLWSGSQAHPVRADQQAAVRVQGILPEESARKEGKR